MKSLIKENILDIGVELLNKKGYNGIGIKEVLDEAQIPKGSFYHYFKSKEDFGLQVVKRYSDSTLTFLKFHLEDKSISPKERLLQFFDEMQKIYINKECKEGCLLGNSATELADVNVRFASLLQKEFLEYEEAFEKCIQQAIEQGEINSDKSAKKIAGFILNSFEGAVLRMKVVKSVEPIEILSEFIKTEIFK
ncbi:TetR family transcriptional regulator C-terminal domain-containing protein [Flavobacteriaceae bacterium AH-315-B10]|nr:TetR family transcriptional regulator C-terminal domain-containing protein [Flavobacteriaceae bacterium AH-315-B10]